MDSFTLSKEQQVVITSAKTHNVICDSVAGSGKTTTILGIAKAYPKQKICMLTYNARLKFETRERVDNMKLTNIEVNSYHSFCCSHYLKNTSTDEKIRKIINENIQPIKPLDYTMLIVDEVQDMTDLYYELVCKIVYDNTKGVRIIITGDTHQSIYTFNMADERYLINGDMFFNFNQLPWVKTNLSISYRTTKPIADFLNKCVLKEDRIISVKDSDYKPRYLICNSYIKPFEYTKKEKEVVDMTIYEEIHHYLNAGYSPGDIFVIAPSIKTKSPVRELINQLREKSKDMKLFVASDEKKKITDEEIKDKLTFITYHQAKGLERKVCIVYGFDSGYFETFKTTNIDCICPNETYVALTRSTERLSIIHHNTKGFIQFLDTSKLYEYVEVINKEKDKKTFRQINKRHLKSNELTDYSAELITSTAMKYIKTEEVKENKKCNVSQMKSESKMLSIDILRNAVYQYYLFTKYGINKPLEKLIDVKRKSSFAEKRKLNEYGIIETINNVLEKPSLSLHQFLKVYHMYYCCENNCLNFLNDDWDYDNVSYEDMFKNLDKVFDFTKDEYNEYSKTEIMRNKKLTNVINIEFDNEKIMKDVIKGFDIKQLLNGKDIEQTKSNSHIKKIFFNTDTQSALKVSIHGNIDVLCNDCFTIIHLGDEIKTEDIINAAICGYVIETMYKCIKKIRIYNPFLDTFVNVSYENMNNVYAMLLLNRFIGFKQLTNDLFIEQTMNIYNKYFGDEEVEE